MMFYSERLNLLFIASPKTGSTSVESFLLKLDPDGERFRISIEDRVIDSSHVKTDSLGHATAIEFKQVLGAVKFNSLRTFGFVRDPFEKVVSAYFFTRTGSLIGAFGIRTAKSKWRLVSKRVVSILAARLLPFSVWAYLFPMKKCSDYFLNNAGRLMVDYLGATRRLNHDLQAILNDLDLDVGAVDVPHLNTSNHESVQKYLQKDGVLYRRLARKYADDLRLYELVKNKHVSRRSIEALLDE